jgi:hypothetical protein
MFKKPNTKSITGVALAGGSIVIGAKVGDGIAAVMPESTNGYKRWILGVGGIVAAACINPTTTTAQVAQNACLGLGAKQLYDELSDTLASAIPVKVSASVTDKFVNAVVGHKEVPVASLGAAWMGDNSDMWDRPLLEEQPQPQPVLAFTGL